VAASKRERLAKWTVSGPPLLYLLVFFAAPTLIMVLASFRSPGEFGGLAPFVDEAGKVDLNLESWARFFTEPVFFEIFVKSVWYATLTTLFCLVLAYPLAALIARSPRRYRDLLLLLVILPFWSNFLIRVYAWMIILGPNQALARGVNAVLALFGHAPVPLLFSSFAVLVCLVYVHLPFMVLPLYANLSKMDLRLLEAASDLGATPWVAFWRVTVPLSLAGIVAGSMLVFIPCVGEYVTPELLGGPSTLMIGRVIWDENFSNNDPPVASAIAVVLVLLIVVPLALFNRYQAQAEEAAK